MDKYVLQNQLSSGKTLRNLVAVGLAIYVTGSILGEHKGSNDYNTHNLHFPLVSYAGLGSLFYIQRGLSKLEKTLKESKLVKHPNKF